MPTPLVDIDANNRQPGFKSMPAPSKIPSPPKAQRDRRSPFSVSAAGSPRYTAMSVSSKISATPKASKIPRKSTPTHVTPPSGHSRGRDNGAQYQRLPSSGGSRKDSATATSLGPNPKKPVSMSGRNKPLPSPPIAQIVNPASPPKAQRTLVDADAGSPTEEEWPTLKPENVSPLETRLSVPGNALTQQQRSVSEGATPRQTAIPVAASQNSAVVGDNGNRGPLTNIHSSKSLEHDKIAMLSNEPRTASPPNRYARSFHALSTHDSMAMESPLAHKCSSNVLSVPPRISSKRNSLPLLNTDQSLPNMEALPVPTRQIKPGSTRWPILEAIQDDRRLIEDSALAQQKNDLESSGDPQSRPVSAFTQQFAESVGTSQRAQSQHGSIDTASTWSMAAGSSLNDEPECEYEGTTRIKRLSWHSSSSGTGPVLRISMDADSILLENSVSVPELPALPDTVPEKVAQERSLGGLAGRLSRHTISMVSSGIGSRSPAPNHPVPTTNKHKPVKISPIRTMQPPREPGKKRGVDSPHLPVSSSSSISDTPNKANITTTCYSAIELPNVDDKLKPPKDNRKRLSMPWLSAKSTPNMTKTVDEIQGSTKALPAPVKRPNTSYTIPTEFNGRLPEVARSKSTTGSTRSPGFQPKSQDGTPKSVIKHPPRSTSLRTPSPAHKESNKVNREEEKVTKRTPKKVKVKRSFQEIFRKREVKPNAKPVSQAVSKRSSIAGSTFAQRFKGSTSFSRANLSKSPEPVVDAQQSTSNKKESFEEAGDRNAALSALEAGSSDSTPDVSPPSLTETATVINKIVDQVTAMEKSSPDRLRGVEIAEAVLRSLELYQKATCSADLAKKHAKDAELNVERASIELNKLQKLCTPDFNMETLQAIKDLVRSAELEIPKAKTPE